MFSMLFNVAFLLVEGISKGNEALDSKDIVKIVITHSAAAAVAGMGAGVLPGAGVIVATGIATGAVWAMYVRIAKYLRLKIDKHVWKVIVSAVLSNLVKSLGAVAGTMLVAGLAPGVSIVTSGILNFALTYVAGLIFLKALTGIFHAGGNPEKMTKEQMKAHFEKTAKSVDVKAAFTEAKSAFKQMKKDGSLNEQAKEADISEEAILTEDTSEE